MNAMKRIAPALLDDMLKRAADSERRRVHHNLHESAADPIQRLLVAALRDAYFRVHRHPEKRELLVLLRGECDVLVFDETGVLTDRIRLGAEGDALLYELPPRIYHTLVPQSRESVFFEVKQGPYDPATAAEFAPWTPVEGSLEAQLFGDRLRRLAIGESAS